ncbi:hypothetical protein [Micromonospora sp. NPDC005652]|uniref:hypothetical protein n=1 Tax=Micromonospora sp. NPDC005652 TaxID=3157046 RepID=UPI0033EE82E8
MSIETVAKALAAAAAFAEEHQAFVVTAAGVLVAAFLVTGWLVRRYAKSHGKGKAVGAFFDSAAVLVAVALSAEGMWEVTTEKMKLGYGMALLVFGFVELAMLRAARRARAKVDNGKRPGVYGVLVWLIAIAAGVAAASAASSPAEFLIRLLAPSLVAGQWFADLIDELREKDGVEHQASAWIWTPRRIGIQLGLIQPGTGDDLNEVLRQRNIERMVRTARRLLAAKPARARRLAAKLQRLGEAMDEASMTAVVERYQRGERVQEVLFGRRLVAVPDSLSAVPDKGADSGQDKLSGSTDSDADKRPDNRPDSGQDNADSSRGQRPDSLSSQVNKGADNLLPLAREIVLDLSGQGLVVNRSALGSQLRTRGVRVGGDKLADLWKSVRDNAPGNRVNGRSPELTGTK